MVCLLVFSFLTLMISIKIYDSNLNIKRELPIHKPKKAISQRDLLNGSIIHLILKANYQYETRKFSTTKVFRTLRGLLKVAFKFLEYKYDYVYNEVLTKQFNGLKSFFTSSTFMHEMFIKTEKAKPLVRFKLCSKFITGLLAKTKNFFNLTGSNVTHKTFLVSDNTTYDYAHDLKTFNETRKNLYFKLTKEKQGFRYNFFKRHLVKNTFKKQHVKLRCFGYKVKIRNNARKIKHKVYRIVANKKKRTFKYRHRKIRSKRIYKSFSTLLHLTTL